jgi:hypothetical protein
MRITEDPCERRVQRLLDRVLTFYFGGTVALFRLGHFVPRSFGECAPEMSKEERDFAGSSAANRPDEASAVELEFGPVLTSMLHYLI